MRSATFDNRFEHATLTTGKERSLEQYWLDVIAAAREEQELFNFDSCIAGSAHAHEIGAGGELSAPGELNLLARPKTSEQMQHESEALVGPTIPVFARIIGHDLHLLKHRRQSGALHRITALLTGMLVGCGLR